MFLIRADPHRDNLGSHTRSYEFLSPWCAPGIHTLQSTATSVAVLSAVEAAATAVPVSSERDLRVICRSCPNLPSSFRYATKTVLKQLCCCSKLPAEPGV